MGGILASFWDPAYFQGQTVSFMEGDDHLQVCTMINHHQTPFGRILLELFPGIQNANPRKESLNFSTLGVAKTVPWGVAKTLIHYVGRFKL